MQPNSSLEQLRDTTVEILENATDWQLKPLVAATKVSISSVKSILSKNPNQEQEQSLCSLKKKRQSKCPVTNLNRSDMHHKQNYVEYKIDYLFSQHGHTILRLPPYHLDLNPIEMIWASVKNYVAANNVTLKHADAKRLAEEKFSAIKKNGAKFVCG
ncbi:hypothetical protein ILUMI_10327 [Ignelater luminosus]|uniref:Tc1-like transposase DDE domain-containing protein n=1 Tax=Ignelater luminosus TaxID=2038154 RepID=A0A8K0D3H0_IGNLU|nr:hypothetical protein ILUMI_10327 [Ignelater luminosus]